MKRITLKTCGIFVICFILLAFLFDFYNKPVLTNYFDSVSVYYSYGSTGATPVKYENSGKIRRIYGESVLTDMTVEDIKEKFKIKFVAVESKGGVINYYGYSDKFRYKAQVFGYTVNTHIAVDGERVYFGTPIIFGNL